LRAVASARPQPGADKRREQRVRNRVMRRAAFAAALLFQMSALAQPDAVDTDPPPTPATGASTATGEGDSRIEQVVVIGRSQNLVGEAPAASMGIVGQAEIERIPFLRTGEVLEVIPGLIATQHSGTGKANQFFLRGFNLDHGTDFSVFLDGVPLNLPTHGHGQGYLDLNSLIPEIIELVEYRKGPYYADVGDFSSAGTSRIEYLRTVDRPFIKAGFGKDDYYRVVGAASPRIYESDLLLAIETEFYDGPWELSEDLGKFNGVAKWTWGDETRGFSLLAAGYSSSWTSTDQIARRAVRQGLIDRLGNLDDDTGGDSARYTGSARFWNGAENTTRAQLYIVSYDLDLWSNFTYFLDDPVSGDEFKQIDNRTIVGFDGSQDLQHALGRLQLFHTLGAQVRYDDIADVGLFHTLDRERIGVVRKDQVDETSLGLYWKADAPLLSWLRANAGLRGDLYWFEVDAKSLPENSGDNFDTIVSPKVGVVLGPWEDTEVYLNYGRSFHSNDARGATISTDPVTGDPAPRVDALVSSEGAEIGSRSAWLPGLQSTLAFWWLELDSELLFIGDAGNTEATRPSRRYGVEVANHWSLLEWLTLDADVTFTRAEFSDSDPAGDDIPGAIETTVVGGAAVDFDNGLFGSLRLRHFGERPLVESGAVKSDPTTLVNLQAGWEWADFPWGDVTFTFDVLNLFDSSDDDITYLYTSRLPGEPAQGTEDKHVHPVEPRTFRGYVTWRY
jgi:hypothetical protein